MLIHTVSSINLGYIAYRRLDRCVPEGIAAYRKERALHSPVAAMSNKEVIAIKPSAGLMEGRVALVVDGKRVLR